jgi:hypothetical protein
MRLEIVNNLSGQTVIVAKEDMGGFFDGRDVLAVLWHPDGRRFGLIYAESEVGPWVRHSTYQLQKTPLGAREAPEDKWVKSELWRRTKHGDLEQSSRAKKILQMKWPNW